MTYVPNFAPGDVLTAAQMNSIGDAWDSFGSGTNWKAATTNPALGNGTWSARYSRVNKMIWVRGRITMGSTTTYGSGGYRIDLPVTAQTTGWAVGDIIGWAEYFDQGGPFDYVGSVHWLSSTQCRLMYTEPNILGNISVAAAQGTPVTFTTSDAIKFTFMYEAA